MSNEVLLRVSGFPEVLARLDRFSDKVQTRISRKAVVAGAQIIARVARHGARRRTGVLKAAIFAHYSPKRSRKEQVVVALVRARSGKKQRDRVSKKGKKLADRDAYYAGWVEFGHRIVPRDLSPDAKLVSKKERNRRLKQRRSNSKTRVRDYPFLAPAYRGTKFLVLQKINDVVKSEIESA
jgi:hypothetical protein